MAETVEYIVRIVGLGGDDEEKKEKEKPSALASGLEGLQKAMHPVKTVLSHKKDEGAAAYFGKETAKGAINMLETITVTTVDRYFRLSEDYKSQNYLNNVMGNINRAKQLGSSALTGAIGGAQVGGVWGAIGGTLLGVVSTGIQQSLEYKNQLIEYKSALNTTRIDTAFRAERAGLYDGGKGTEN